MQSKWIEQNFKYNGEQLKSLFIYGKFEILGNAIVSWQGPCDVSFEHMVDAEDLRNQSPIQSDQMLHFISEVFHRDLLLGITLQRLLTVIIYEQVAQMSGKKISRDGDDLFFDNRKLSVSIATISPVSSLIHFGLNVENSGTPVPTSCLTELGIETKQFAQAVMNKFAKEWISIEAASLKTRAVN